MSSDTGQKLAYIGFFIVIAIAVTGYFIGLQSPMNPNAMGTNSDSSTDETHHSHANSNVSDTGVVAATHYRDIRQTRNPNTQQLKTRIDELKSMMNPLEEITITDQQKSYALAVREMNRAFNGAPPTIPHPVDQLSSQSCMVCHGEGAKTESMRISKMSHQFLTNCTQCHVESQPTHMAALEFRENTFVGLPAPTQGPRAFVGAPPQIPHSTWMRIDCASCHGPTGVHGIRTTHPWRTNCQQCHAPSSELEQVQLESKPNFLPGPKIER